MILHIFKNKIFFFIKIFLFYFILSSKAYSDDINKINNLVTLGSDSAVIKIKVFSSFTCPHCADFHIKVVPEIKKKYIDTGKVQLIFIDFPLDQAAFNASKILHCLDKKKQINFLDIVYETQEIWTNGTDINDINKNLKEVAKDLGISNDDFDRCLIDEAISDKILNGRIEASKKYSVKATPTIIINEEKLEDSASFNNIKKWIEKII